ncbi:MAG: Uma2 family endonuclease [Polyangiaceae bacterium]
MSGTAQKLVQSATIEELLAMPEEDRYEIVDGALEPKEAARGPHGRAQARAGHLLSPYDRRGGGPPERPGGYWFATEPQILFTPQQVRRPDVVAWRRERMPEMPADVPITILPDWICEILSPSNAGTDTVLKMNLYHQCQVGHYWILDPQRETLTVYRWTREGYLYVLGACRGDRVRAEPFEAIDLQVGVFFGDDEA